MSKVCHTKDTLSMCYLRICSIYIFLSQEKDKRSPYSHQSNYFVRENRQIFGMMVASNIIAK